MSTANPTNPSNPINPSIPNPVPPAVAASAVPAVAPLVASAVPPDSDREEAPTSIYLVSYPKIVFLYPTLIFAILAWLVMLLLGKAAEPDGVRHRVAELITLSFLMLTAVNLVVIAFDFPRTTSLTLFFGFAASMMGAVLLFTNYPDLVKPVTNFLDAVKPWANAQFYGLFAVFLGLLYVVVWIMARFDYWEVRPNELMHHHGFLSDLERFSAPNLRISKEINDVFEYMLLRSGRLILHPTNEPRAFVLDNVLNINRKEAQITKMLGALQVEFRPTTPQTP
ncbi:MAG: hypothetical protein ACKV2Q_04140 [Planctomycetaceae bacterium]